MMRHQPASVSSMPAARPAMPTLCPATTTLGPSADTLRLGALLVLALTTIIGTTACAADSPRRVTIERTDSAGVAIITNRGADFLVDWTFTPTLTLGGECRVPAARVVDEQGIADYLPAIDRIRTAPNGTIWVQRYAIKG